jgi:hypothetical protein
MHQVTVADGGVVRRAFVEVGIEVLTGLVRSVMSYQLLLKNIDSSRS